MKELKLQIRTYIAELLLTWVVKLLPQTDNAKKLIEAIRNYMIVALRQSIKGGNSGLTEEQIDALVGSKVKHITARERDNAVYNTDTRAIEKVLEENGYIVTQKRNIEYATQLILSTGSKLNCYSSGRVFPNGKKDEKLSQLFR